MKITGLDAFSRQMDDASKALKDLDGEIGKVSFNPNDPGSIEIAIQSMNAMIDEKTSAYANNPVIGPLAEAMKEKYREAILEKAAEERLKGDDNNE